MKKMQCYFKLKWHKKYQIVGSHSDLEVIVAGEGDEEVEKETFAVFIDLRSVMIQTWPMKINDMIMILWVQVQVQRRRETQQNND